MQEPGNNDTQNELSDWRRWLGMGIEFGGVVAVFCYMGYLLDAKLETSPWFLLAGFFISSAGMFYMIFKQVWNMRNGKQ